MLCRTLGAREATGVRTLRASILAFTALLLVGCTSAGSPTGAGSPSVAGSPLGSPAEAWAEDLDQLDSVVRSTHVSPFTIHSEAEWVAKLAEVRPKLAGASADERFVLVASLVGLLDTHTFITPNGGVRAYEVVFYKFSDGWFVIAAKDESLLGTRLISIGGHPVEEVEATLRPLVPHDNESGFVDAVAGPFSFVEYLHGSGIVVDPSKPQYVLERSDGTRTTVDFPSLEQAVWEAQFEIVGGLIGAAPPAVARRREPAWTSPDPANKAFLISINDYGDMSSPATAMTAALDAGAADRVVLDLRYLRGGSGDFPLYDVPKDDPRVNRPGGLTVLIGRENVSAATVIDWYFDTTTEALLVGEPTPARADNFRCQCEDIELEHTRIVVTLPTEMSHNGDLRAEIAPDVLMALSSADYFAGRDPVVDAALAGLTQAP